MSFVQKLEVAFTLLFLSALGLLGCHSLTPAQQAKLGLFECQAAALAPLVEPALDATDLARDLYAGKADLGRVLGSLQATQAEADALVSRLQACRPVPAPALPLDQTEVL